MASWLKSWEEKPLRGAYKSELSTWLLLLIRSRQMSCVVVAADVVVLEVSTQDGYGDSI